MPRKERYKFMLVPKEKRDELESIIKKFREEHNEFQAKDDIVQELGKIGFLVVAAHLSDNLDGMILVDESSKRIGGYPSNKLIFVDTDKDYYSSRFILMHELSHYIERRYSGKNTDTSRKNSIFNSSKILLAARDHQVGYSNNPFEQEKDYMAAALLVPKDEFVQDINKYLSQTNQERNKSTIESLKNDNVFLHNMQWKYRVEKDLISRRTEEIAEDELI